MSGFFVSVSYDPCVFATGLSTAELILITVMYIFAVHRVTRLVTRDALPFIKVPREAFIQRWGAYEDDENDDFETRKLKRKTSINGKKTNIVMASLAYLWECDWCASIWWAGILGWLTWTFPETMFYVLAGLIASSVTGTWALVEKRLSKD